MDRLDIQPNLALTFTPKTSSNVGWNLFRSRKPLSDLLVGAHTGQRRYKWLRPQDRSADECEPGMAATSYINVAGTYVHYTPGERVRQSALRSGAVLVLIEETTAENGRSVE